MSCNSFNVIYVGICSGCLEEYIGEMGVDKRWRNGCRQKKIKIQGQSIQTAHKTIRASAMKS